MEITEDPLKQLLGEDVQSIDRNRLATFLSPYVRFEKLTKDMHFLVKFESIISNDAKIEVILLAAKAKSLLFDEPDGLAPSQIISLEVMPTGSVKSSLKKLSDTRKIKKDSQGRYLIPNYGITDAMNRASKGQD